ncbi:MAG: hypothetical protein CM15mV51_0860 [uncultured marine virus]|nr:MAG: hypothetical protein CM15mV51_0860 [uncultured marine virus]
MFGKNYTPRANMELGYGSPNDPVILVEKKFAGELGGALAELLVKLH